MHPSLLPAAAKGTLEILLSSYSCSDAVCVAIVRHFVSITVRGSSMSPHHGKDCAMKAGKPKEIGKRRGRKAHRRGPRAFSPDVDA